jgi:hypothetical protein
LLSKLLLGCCIGMWLDFSCGVCLLLDMTGE